LRGIQQYGRQIYGDTFYALAYGPVPGGAYDIVKYVGGPAKGDLNFPEALGLLEVHGDSLGVRGHPDTELLSRSDITCLLEAARKYGKMPFGKLKKLSHQGKAVENAGPNGEMKLSDLVEELKGAEAIASHLEDRNPGETHLKKDPAHHAKRHAA
jgi:hypothetical protein